MAGTHREHSGARLALAARQVNARIYSLVEALDPARVDFLCECGCLGFVVRTPAEYDADGGAFRSRHAGGVDHAPV
jgi:hypothetical protein